MVQWRTKASENLKDPATGRNLPKGVVFRGPNQYRARKLVDRVRVAQTLETAELARAWLEKTSVAVRDGIHVDRSSVDKLTSGDLIDEFVAKMMQDDGERRGAAEDRRGHIPALKNDPIAKLKLSKVTSAAVLAFRDRQKLTYAPETVVKRLNMLARIFNVAIGEWKMPIPINPPSADNVPCPSLEGEYRDRRLMEPTEAEIKAAAAAGEEPPEKEETWLPKAAEKSIYPHDKSLISSQSLRRYGRKRCSISGMKISIPKEK